MLFVLFCTEIQSKCWFKNRAAVLTIPLLPSSGTLFSTASGTRRRPLCKNSNNFSTILNTWTWVFDCFRVFKVLIFFVAFLRKWDSYFWSKNIWSALKRIEVQRLCTVYATKLFRSTQANWTRFAGKSSRSNLLVNFRIYLVFSWQQIPLYEHKRWAQKAGQLGGEESQVKGQVDGKVTE